MKISICRKAHFNAAHRLYNSAWDEQKNKEIFGKCANANYHGHNYLLEVWIKGKIDPETGYVMNLKDLKQIIEEHIEDRFDHKNLNLDTEEFKNLNPTAENICLVIWQILRKQLNSDLQLKVRLHETERNIVEFDGE